MVSYNVGTSSFLRQILVSESSADMVRLTGLHESTGKLIVDVTAAPTVQGFASPLFCPPRTHACARDDPDAMHER